MVDGFWFDWFPSKVIFALKQASGMEDLVDREKVLGSIEALNMPSFNLAVIPPFVKDMDNLKYLDLSENQIKGFIDCSCLPSSVEVVDLSENNITSFSFEGWNNVSSVKLSVINLNGNRISTMPKGLGECRSVRVLTMIDNQIDSFGEGFELHDQVEELYLSGNAISEISDKDAGQLSKCRELYLGHNHLKSIPLSLLQGNLKVLDLQGNSLDNWDFLTEAAKRGIEVQV